jgi:hypothetical protein
MISCELSMTRMKETDRPLIVAVLAFAMLAGCAETSLPQATGKGTINFINAMPASPSVTVLIEERAISSVAYKATLGAQAFDDLSYNFNFNIVLLGSGGPTRIATQFIDMAADTDYTLVLNGSVTAPVITQWEVPEREWSDTETVFEAAIAHLSPALGDVDVYVAPTGTAPVLGEERAKVSYLDRAPEIDLEAGEYEVIITARDDPATVLYQSHPGSFVAQTSYTFSIFDADPSIPGNISVRANLRSGLDIELPDSNFLPTLRTVHSAFGTANFDIFRDEDFTAPIYSDLGLGETTGDLPVTEGTAIYTYTDVATGAIIDEETQSVARGARMSTVVSGQPGTDLTRIFLTDNRRSIETHAKLRFIHAASNILMLDLYLVDVGAEITDLTPTIAGLNFAFGTDFVAQVAGSSDLILTLPDEQDPIAPVTLLDLSNGDVVEVLITDSVDPAVADIVITHF